MMKNIGSLLVILMFVSCTQTGVKFIDCSDEKNANLAVDITLSSMENTVEILDRLDIICKEKKPLNWAECYTARYGNKDFGNRGMIVVNDKYVGECIIHEMYHADLYVKFGDTCNAHDEKCGWDWYFLEEQLDTYKQLRK